MKDYIVTSAHIGTAYWLPRIVRADSAKEALRAAMVDVGIEPTRTRKLPGERIPGREVHRVYYMVTSTWKGDEDFEGEQEFVVREWASISSEYRSRFYQLNPQEFVRVDRRGGFVRRWSTLDYEVAS